jgi:cyclopropane fatty-acyl-phospholipid synthase-like methyltransferase
MGATAEFFQASYQTLGRNAQRRYPNEELCRFMGRRLFSISPEHRKDIRVLEVGCGSGANLWMIAQEGFDAHGIELAPEGIALCKQLLDERNLSAHLYVGDMSETGLPSHHFDIIIDVFSSYCLPESGYLNFISEANRLLKQGGILFSYTPSQSSDAFKNYAPAMKLDASTLNGIKRKHAAFSGQTCPFRFETVERIERLWRDGGFHVDYCETVGRTYRHLDEYFEFIVFEASLPSESGALP